MHKYDEKAAATNQDKIGWMNFMLGQMAPEWAAARQAYLDWDGLWRTV
jgi:hypothetical protein